MSERAWTPTAMEHPPDGARVEWLDPNTGAVQQGTIYGRIWAWDDGLYAYYTPAFWRQR